MSDGKYNYEYDGEGNRTKRTEIATGIVTEYTWDYRNRLTRVVDKDAQGNVVKEADYTYDVGDRRIAKSVTNGAAPAQVERMVYDGDNIALTFDGNGSQTHRYLYGPNVDQVLADENVQGKALWALADNEGTVRDLVDSSGTIQNHLTYDSFGNITSQTNPAVDFRYGYTGREFDKETGQYYYRSRYLDPFTGTFINPDPIGFGGGDTNLYRYVQNNPIDFTDPSGNGPRGATIGAGFGIFFGGLAGLAGGAGAGTFATPGPGTFFGGLGGYEVGVAVGAAGGAIFGDAVENIANYLYKKCRDIPLLSRIITPTQAPPTLGGFGGGSGLSVPKTVPLPRGQVLDPRDLSTPRFPHRPLTRREVANLYGPHRRDVDNLYKPYLYEIIQQEGVNTSSRVGSGLPWVGTGKEPQWDNIKSTKAYGHSVQDHGPQRKASSMQDRANSKGEQGQWYNVQDIIEAEKIAPKHPGKYIIDFQRPIGRVFVKNGDAQNPVQNVTRAYVQRNADGTIKTTYPVRDTMKINTNE